MAIRPLRNFVGEGQHCDGACEDSATVAALEPGSNTGMTMQITRISAGAKGLSQFSNVEVACSDEIVDGFEVLLFAALASPSVRFVSLADGFEAGMHPIEERRLVFVMSGVLELGTPDGETRVLGRGEVLLAEDTDTTGHTTSTVGGPAAVMLASTIGMPAAMASTERLPSASWTCWQMRSRLVLRAEVIPDVPTRLTFVSLRDPMALLRSDCSSHSRDTRYRLSCMTAKTVTRSIRFDEATNAELEALANAAGKSVSEYVRDVIAEVAARESRIAAHARAMTIFASLPQIHDPDKAREEMWGIGTRVPR